jgi:hypothetical protein
MNYFRRAHSKEGTIFHRRLLFLTQWLSVIYLTIFLFTNYQVLIFFSSFHKSFAYLAFYNPINQILYICTLSQNLTSKSEGTNFDIFVYRVCTFRLEANTFTFQMKRKVRLFFSCKYRKFRVRENHKIKHNQTQWHNVNDFYFCFVPKCLHISNSRTKPIKVEMARIRNKESKTCIQKLNPFAFLLPSDFLQIPTVHVVFKYLIKHCQHVQLLQIQCTHALMLEISF